VHNLHRVQEALYFKHNSNYKCCVYELSNKWSAM